MTTKELLEELRYIPSGLGCMDTGCEGCAYEEKERERLEKEIEASIRKEVLEDILELREAVYEDLIGDYQAVTVGNIVDYALSKGITLK